MTKFRRIIAIVMILLIAVTCVPMGAFAEDAEGQKIITEDTAPETTVETEIEVPPEEDTVLLEEEEIPAEPETVPEEAAMDPVDETPEEEDQGITEEPEQVIETEVPVIEEAEPEEEAVTDPVTDAHDDESAEDDIIAEELAAETEPEVPKTEEPAETEPEDELELTVRGNMMLAAEPTRDSATLRMIDMDQYSYSFSSRYPEPFKNESRRRTVQFWFGDTPAYCLQFGKEAESGMAYTSTDVWDGISESDRRLLSWILRFGYVGWCRYGAQTSQEYMATQVLIWQVLSHSVNTSWEQAICDEMMGSGSYAQEVYWKIKANVYEADTIPSFCSSSDNSSTPVYDLEKQADGKYSVILTDTNGVLSRFDFSQDGVSAVRDGNTLTISLDRPAEELTLTANKDFSDWTSGNVMFWRPGNTSGYQYMGSFDTDKAPEQVRAVFKVTSPTGYLDITKVSANTACTNGNAMYSMEGTTFQVKDADGNIVGTLVVDENGKVETLDLPSGTYTVTETKAGKGYIRNTEVKTVTVTAGETATVTFANEPVADPVSIYLRKWDAEADRYVPQGKGTFAGAQYRVEYYDNTNWSGTAKAVWVFQTDENGIMRYLPSYKVSGPDLYTINGAYGLPLGSVKISEIKAPKGYLVSQNTLYAKIRQNGNVAEDEWTTESLGFLKVFSDGYGMPESIIHGGVRFKKSDYETGRAVSGAEIAVYSNCDETVIVNGTEYSKGDLIITLTTDENGICETEGDLLPYGSYYAVEKKASDRYLLNENWRVDFSITENLKVLDLTTGSNVLQEQIIRGGVRFKKSDLETDEPVSGAEISIYNGSNEDVYVNGSFYGKDELITTLVTDENGICETANDLLSYGDYYAKETKASEGYLLNSDWTVSFRIRDNGKIVDMTDTDSVLKEQIIRGGVRFKKVDKETGTPVSGAEITVYSSNENDVLVDGTCFSKDEAITTLVTGEDGTCETSADYLPYGSYYAIETKASEGYLLNEGWRVGFDIRNDGEIVDLTDGDSVLEEQIVHGDLSMLKLDIDGNYKANVPFMIVRIDEDGTEGESHVIVTDENGMIDTSSAARKHTNNTNSMDQYAAGGIFTDISRLDASAGVWFGDSEPDDNLGALPYGRYKVYELQTETLASEQINMLESRIIEITQPDKTVTLVPMVNLNIELTSEAASAESNDFIAAATVWVVDTVHYTNLTSHRKYTMETQFVLKSTSEVLGTVSKDFYPPDGPNGTGTAGGSVTLEAEIDAAGYDGDFVVACDYLYEYVMGTKILIASHSDMEDAAQTIKIPSIRTNARDSRTNDNVGTVCENAEIIDTVSFTNLKKGEVFKLVSKLGDIETGEYIKGKDGEDLIVEQGFVCWTENGSVEMPAFLIDSREHAGKSVVVVEELYWVDEENDTEVLMTSHISFDDKDQTITYPEIHTTAADESTVGHVGVVSEETVITDTVKLSGLIPGSEYTVSGTLVYKEKFTDKDGVTHKEGDSAPVMDDSVTEVTFTADAADMEIVLSYVIDSAVSEGHTAVVFEDLIHNGVTVASHADLEDKEQSVYFPELRTQAIDKESGSCFVTKGEEVILEDTVSYSNLIPGETYIVKGVLMDKNTGTSTGIISESAVFEPNSAEDSVTVQFAVDTEANASCIFVVFEDLYLIKEDGSEILIVKHEDLDDEAQTLYSPEIGTTATDAVSGTHEAQGTESTAVIDRVEYRNLKAGEKYTVTGTLMDKSTGEPVVIDGEAVTAEAEFTADDKDGTVELTFVFDGTELVGKTVVAFESLMYEDLEIAVHADIDDEDQSVNIINIRTLARDGQNGTRTAEWNHEAVIVDTVSYKGLTPGKQYTLYGVIVLRSTGEYLVQENGIIEAVMEFVPEEPDGTAEMEFTVDTEALQGQDLVVFERLYEGSVYVGDIDVIVPVARHEDVNDRDQTVSVPVRPVPVPLTGDDSNINLWGALCIMSLVLLLQLNGKRKRR